MKFLGCLVSRCVTLGRAAQVLSQSTTEEVQLLHIFTNIHGAAFSCLPAAEVWAQVPSHSSPSTWDNGHVLLAQLLPAFLSLVTQKYEMKWCPPAGWLFKIIGYHFIIEFLEFFIYSECKFFMKHAVCKHFLRFCGLSSFSGLCLGHETCKFFFCLLYFGQVQTAVSSSKSLHLHIRVQGFQVFAALKSGELN